VIENFSPRVMERFGLDERGMANRHADTVYVRMPAFGLDNAWRDRPAFQHTIEPLAGLAWISGYPDRDPQPIMVCDALGGVHAAFAMLCGIRHRERTGVGVHVEVRLSEVAAAIAAEQSVTASATGTVLERIGNRHRRCGPQGVHRCAADDGDAWIAISIDTDDQWRTLRDTVDSDAWSDALDDVVARRRSAAEIDRELASWCGERHVDDVTSSLAQAGIPFAVVATGSELLANPQLAARRFFTPLAHPVCGELSYPGLPMRITRGDATVSCDPRSPAPVLGEDDELVESLLGLSHDDARRLNELGVTGARTTSNTPM
jgi:crotonobetainyl-CoA:carnitine CoA-transferase CaiB-like acyl-CoA transferase